MNRLPQYKTHNYVLTTNIKIIRRKPFFISLAAVSEKQIGGGLIKMRRTGNRELILCGLTYFTNY